MDFALLFAGARRSVLQLYVSTPRQENDAKDAELTRSLLIRGTVDAGRPKCYIKARLFQEEMLRKNKSAIKRATQAEKRRLRNSHVKSTMKTHIKKALTAVNEKDKANVEAVTRTAIAYLDKASSKGVIHKNQASRRVSRLAKKAHKVLAES